MNVIERGKATHEPYECYMVSKAVDEILAPISGAISGVILAPDMGGHESILAPDIAPDMGVVRVMKYMTEYMRRRYVKRNIRKDLYERFIKWCGEPSINVCLEKALGILEPLKAIRGTETKEASKSKTRTWWWG